MHFIQAKSILSAQNSMNVYRGCTHGCIYCDSRSKCYQMSHPFEDVAVKINAPELLETMLRKKRKPCVITTGSMSDPYLPIERKLELTRKCLTVIEKYGFGLSILTKSDGILRDLALLSSINQRAKCVVQMTLTTFDDDLCRILEPDVCVTSRRFEVLKQMRDNVIPTMVWLCPVLPYINDTRENIQGLLDYCVQAGVRGVVTFGMGMTLREGNREYFYRKLDQHFPGLKARYQKEFGNSYEIQSPRGNELYALAESICRANGMLFGAEECFAWMYTWEDKMENNQLTFG